MKMQPETVRILTWTLIIPFLVYELIKWLAIRSIEKKYNQLGEINCWTSIAPSGFRIAYME